MRGNGIIPTAGHRTRCSHGGIEKLRPRCRRRAARLPLALHHRKKRARLQRHIPEKYNVVTGSHEVFVEYGNVGTKFAYIATEGFGWMNASFEVGMNYLSSTQLADLHRLKPPAAKQAEN
jgi:hypothetical protein